MIYWSSNNNRIERSQCGGEGGAQGGRVITIELKVDDDTLVQLYRKACRVITIELKDPFRAPSRTPLGHSE